MLKLFDINSVDGDGEGDDDSDNEPLISEELRHASEQTSLIVKVLRDKANPKRREIIDAIVAILN